MSLSIVTCDHPAHADTSRELARAAKQIRQLEARVVTLTNALADITSSTCGSVHSDGPCACCLHDRMIAQSALDGVG